MERWSHMHSVCDTLSNNFYIFTIYSTNIFIAYAINQIWFNFSNQGHRCIVKK